MIHVKYEVYKTKVIDVVYVLLDNFEKMKQDLILIFLSLCSGITSIVRNFLHFFQRKMNMNMYNMLYANNLNYNKM